MLFFWGVKAELRFILFFCCSQSLGLSQRKVTNFSDFCQEKKKEKKKNLYSSFRSAVSEKHAFQRCHTFFFLTASVWVFSVIFKKVQNNRNTAIPQTWLLYDLKNDPMKFLRAPNTNTDNWAYCQESTKACPCWNWKWFMSKKSDLRG